MSEMVERVAQALLSKAPATMGLTTWEARDLAQAAIEAMRWPTKPMFEGWRSVNCIKDQPCFEKFTYFNGDYGGWLACHQSMIDAALARDAGQTVGMTK